MAYPRDLIGYGAVPPHAAWPGDAAIALQIVVNYEEGGESCILHGDEASERFLSEIIGAEAWKGRRHMSMESIYEYGSRAGFWRLHRELARRGLPVTVFGVAMALERNPEAVKAMQDAGWEIATHGWRWIDYGHMDPAEERAHLERAVAIHEAVTGEKPRGWYTGRDSTSTTELVVEHGGFTYVADSYADDLPYYKDVNGTPTLIVPYTLDTNDMRFCTPQGFHSGDQFYAYLRDAFDVLYQEGLEGSPKMLSIGLHCRIAGRPARIAGLRRFLDHVAAHERVWVARRIDIAEHWLARHPPNARTA
ncbi:MAG: allantoinase PuuE [Alphaproteobacteria bacterium]|nr:allantoinase PuuE [Alphaproteobacteria bacterium]MCB9690647.1 allantoinase PuuE [Alphaproteobacteria bacterium]